MRLLAALVPPEPVLDDLTAVVRSVRGGTNELRHVPAHLLHIPLANFGNVGLNETVALRDALAGELATRPPLGLRFQGGSALDFPGDDSIWAKLGGDVERLAALGAVVPRVVQRLGFLVDRRLFRTSVRIGHITPSTSAGYLERVVGRLDGYLGPAWTAHEVVLLRAREPRGDRGEPILEERYVVSMTGRVSAHPTQ